MIKNINKFKWKFKTKDIIGSSFTNKVIYGGAPEQLNFTFNYQVPINAIDKNIPLNVPNISFPTVEKLPIEEMFPQPSNNAIPGSFSNLSYSHTPQDQQQKIENSEDLKDVIEEEQSGSNPESKEINEKALVQTHKYPQQLYAPEYALFFAIQQLQQQLQLPKQFPYFPYAPYSGKELSKLISVSTNEMTISINADYINLELHNYNPDFASSSFSMKIEGSELKPLPFIHNKNDYQSDNDKKVDEKLDEEQVNEDLSNNPELLQLVPYNEGFAEQQLQQQLQLLQQSLVPYFSYPDTQSSKPILPGLEDKIDESALVRRPSDSDDVEPINAEQLDNPANSDGFRWVGGMLILMLLYFAYTRLQQDEPEQKIDDEPRIQVIEEVEEEAVIEDRPVAVIEDRPVAVIEDRPVEVIEDQPVDDDDDFVRPLFFEDDDELLFPPRNNIPPQYNVPPQNLPPQNPPPQIVPQQNPPPQIVPQQNLPPQIVPPQNLPPQQQQPPVPNNPPPPIAPRYKIPRALHALGLFASGTNNNLRPINPNYFAELFPPNQAVADSVLFSVELEMQEMTDQQLQEIRQGEKKQDTNGFPYYFTHPENGSPKAVLYTRDTVVEGATPEQQTAMLLHTMMHMVLSVVFHKSDNGVVHLTGPAKIRALGQMYIEYLNQHHGLHLTTQHYQMKTVTENGQSRSTSQPVEFDRSSEEWRQAEALKPSIVSKMTGVDPKYAGQREKFAKFFEARKENLDQQENGNGPPRNN